MPPRHGSRHTPLVGRHRLAACALLAVTATGPCAAAAAAFTLTSAAMADHTTLSLRQVYDRNACGGGNMSPDVAWRNTPPKTRSIALTLYDPDAPNGWWHWIVVDIPVRTHALPAGAGDAKSALPRGAMTIRNDFGDTHFDGACPPPGDAPHRYQLTAWALDVPALPVTTQSSGQDVLAQLRAHALATSCITARYGRR